MYAHSENTEGRRHPLQEHLQAVASLAADLAKKFQAESWGYMAGLLHDLGKSQPDFQVYLEDCQNHPEKKIRGPDHSSAGAVLAWQRYWEGLAFLLAGHHGGLPSPTKLKQRLQEKSNNPAVEDVLRHAKNFLALPERPPLPTFPPTQAELFLRFLFSALVDADYLDTEAHFDTGRSRLRYRPVDLEALAESFWKGQDKLSGHDQSSVNLARHKIYHACLAAAECLPGIFRLTVPTGGGKTLSGMAFALRHALKYQKHRIIVAIPYTSIIDQTAQVYRSIFGDENILEHHSAINPREDEDHFVQQQWTRLAAENWDAPIVVTTTVQLFESLFSNRPAACRKLHNLAQSIIILDEVQTLPTGLLAPILEVLQQLVDHYGVTVVLSTATQPSLVDSGSPYLKGLRGEIREIVPDPARYFQTLKRVSYDCPGETWPWERVAREIVAEPQCLTVVNTKKDALAILDALDDPEVLHLSTLLCMAHRRKVLEEIKARLDSGQPCRVVATQVVEAGVDLDFPVVLRAMGPLDRIVQAAGRCNREGRLSQGHVIIFQPAEGQVPPGDYRAGHDIARAMLNRPSVDLHSPGIYENYFRQLYQAVNTDKHRINELRQRLDFPEVATRFKLIEDDSVPMVVRYPKKDSPVDELLQRLQAPGAHLGGEARRLLRRLQPYLVNVRRRPLARYQQAGLVRELALGLWEWRGNYHLVRGLQDAALDPEPLVI
ncbi:MAG: CRISPR-associated helicase Cas3' [Proteobacteria bacterium]|nr:CRISPR-associated helicase Cas3' [Pseudomonadota bacterium]MBU4354413.1 CRISPR-associated helicase Cas3' [Pseudomonadota bacterium]MBU4449079.1 CRISPR-associated helicase Cas3' [Pseudomonadota bacterium]